MKHFIFFSLISFLLSSSSMGWVYPEHREISLIAIKKLNPEDRKLLDALWAEARRAHESRLTENVIDLYQSRHPSFIDYAAWTAIAGDHSCSAEEMLNTILETEWILEVADITAKLKIDLLEAGSKEARLRLNALRDSDIMLQRADPEYATRAGSNNVHFLLSMDRTEFTLDEFIDLSYAEGAELNAIAAYAFYHYSALVKVSNYHRLELSSEEKSSLLLSALADEAFGHHFLQDIFAAGHVAGTWGDASQRKGTHDFYNERGLRTTTWNGKSIVITGDAYMRYEDADRAAIVMKNSLIHLLEAFSGNEDFYFFDDSTYTSSPIDFSLCSNDFVPPVVNDSRFKRLIHDVLIDTPIPGLTSGIGEMPRFRAELGLFGGIAPSIHGSLISGGFESSQKTLGVVGGIDVSIKLGLGMDGVLNDAGDGLAFLSLGWRQDGASSTGIIDYEGIERYGSLLAAIPGRSAFSARIRLPFYLLPFDLLYAGPLVYLISPQDFGTMAVMSANGGLIPWHSGIGTAIGRFQFILGREIGVYLYGRTKERDAIFYLGSDGLASIISFRSTQVEFPILEFRPSRSFATDQSSALLFQFYGGLDIPHHIEVIEPIGVSKPDLENVWFWGIRLIFDWRHYF